MIKGGKFLVTKFKARNFSPKNFSTTSFKKYPKKNSDFQNQIEKQTKIFNKYGLYDSRGLRQDGSST